MIALIICGSIILLLALIMMIRVRLDLSYLNSEFKLGFKLGSYPIKIKPKEKFPYNKDEVIELLKALFRGLGRFGRKLKVERFLLHYTAGGPDPYEAAEKFARTNAVISAIAPITAARIRVRDCDVRTDVDFMAEKTSLDAAVLVSIRIGQLIFSALRIIIAAVKIIIQNRRRLRDEARLMYAHK